MDPAAIRIGRGGYFVASEPIGPMTTLSVDAPEIDAATSAPPIVEQPAVPLFPAVGRALLDRSAPDRSFTRHWLTGFDADGDEIPLHVTEYAPARSPEAVWLILPFTGAHTAQMAPFAKALHDQGFLAASIDPPGHGRSGGIRGVFSVEGVLRSIAATADFYAQRFPDTPIMIAGSSWGGDLAILYSLWEAEQESTAGRHRRISGIFVQAVITPWQRNIIAGFRRDLQLLFQAKAIGSKLAQAALGPRMALSHMFRPSDIYLEHGPRRRFIVDPLRLRSYDTRSYLSYLTYRPVASPEQLRAPLMLVVGGRDRLVPVSHERRVYDSLLQRHPSTFLQTLPEGGHALLEEHADWAADLAADWVRQQVLLPRQIP